MLTHDRLKELLDYDPGTGIFTWRIRKKQSSRQEGTEAGSLNDRGYRRITIDGREYKTHRLAWLYMTGSWPPTMMDHINRVRSDNRWENLRLATPSLNAFNKMPAKLSNSGIRGVYISRGRSSPRKYLAYIGRNATRRAYFSTLEDAIATRRLWESGVALRSPASSLHSHYIA